MSSLESSSPTTASPRFHNNPEKQNLNIKSYLMMLIEDFKKDINNSLKEVQENMSQTCKPLKRKCKIIYELKEYMCQQAEALKEETKMNPLNYYREHGSIGRSP